MSLRKKYTSEQIEKIKFTCQTDLYLFGQFLGKDFVETPHRSMCNFYVKKNPKIRFKEFGLTYQSSRDRIQLVPRETYKALSLDTKVPTTDGMKTIEDVAIGDFVFGIDGRACEVLAKSEIFRDRECFEIEFCTREKVVADADHLWKTKAHKECPGHGKDAVYKVRTTREIAESVRHGSRSDLNHRVAVSSAIAGLHVDLPIEPYTMGAWLGDGTSSCSNITIGDEEVIEAISIEEHTRYLHTSGNASCYGIGQKSKEGVLPRSETFRARLRQLAVLNNKHIPEIYFLSSRNQRHELLMGLMDTDGHCSLRGLNVFSNTNHRLVQDVRRLMCSLGLKAHIRQYTAKLNGEQMGPFWHVSCTAYANEFPLFKIKRKLDRQKVRPTRGGRQGTRSIISVKPVPSVPVQCLSVNSSDNLFLITDSYIPTHNSSIKVVDNVQWLICYPEIRILTVTAAIDLATKFIDEFTAYFTVRGKSFRNPDTNVVEGGRPTEFQELFPEHCITETEANTGEFTSPARKSLPPNLIFKEPTAGTLSMGGTTSGWHCDVLDYDDPVSDRNSETGNQLEKLDDRLAMIYELLMNYGFRHTVATRYDPFDPYVKLAEAHGITELYGDFDSDGLKYMCRPCLWLKGQPYSQPNYALGFPKEAEVDLFFPEGSPYEALRKKFKNAKTFFSQQLNSPTDPNKNPFTEDMIRACMVDHSALPKAGDTYIAWDLAISISKFADYTVGAVGMLDPQGEWWILEVIRGRYNWSECPYQIVKAIQTWRPVRTAIEDALGARNFTESIDRHGREMKVGSEIDWISLGKGTDDAKYERIVTLHPWFTNRRIHLLNTISCLDELVREFLRVGNKRSKNDIPDALARLVLQYSNLSVARSLPSPDQALKDWNAAADDEFYDLIFGQGKYVEGSQENQRLLVGRDGKFWSPNTQPVREEPEYPIDRMTGCPSPYPL